MALDRAGIAPSDIGFVLSGCSAPTWSSPAEAAMVAAEIGIDAPCLDVNSACTTFGMQVDLLNRMVADKLPPFVLIIQPENVTRMIDYSDRSSSVLFGDGSTAAVISASVKARTVFVTSECGTNPSGFDKVAIPTGGYFHQDGNAVQGFAIRRMTESLRDLLSLSAMDPAAGGRFRGRHRWDGWLGSRHGLRAGGVAGVASYQ
jgi:3-oxoacyl-[acyl-carrier-protein] synthase-3